MNTVTIEEAKQNLEELMEQAAHGEPFLIRQSAGSLVKVSVEAAEEPEPKVEGERRLGLLNGKYNVPDDIKKPFEAEINAMFYGEE